MTTTKPPVLTDELDPRLIEWLRARQDQHHVLLDQPAVRQVIAVLARAGADEHQIIAAFLERSGQWLTNQATHEEYARQVRDAALEEAALTAEDLRRTKWQGTNFYASAAVQIATAIRGMKRTAHQRCDLGMGCEQAGVCYAEAMGKADECGAQSADAIRALKGTPAAEVTESMPGWSHWETRIKALMQDMGMPNSHSAYQALAQLANEMGQAHAAAAPQAGQLSGNAGEVEALATQIKDDLQCQFDTDGITEIDSGDALIRLSEALNAVDEAANAASKGANHG